MVEKGRQNVPSILILTCYLSSYKWILCTEVLSIFNTHCTNNQYNRLETIGWNPHPWVICGVLTVLWFSLCQAGHALSRQLRLPFSSF